jgi:hypothetical protein
MILNIKPILLILIIQILCSKNYVIAQSYKIVYYKIENNLKIENDSLLFYANNKISKLIKENSSENFEVNYAKKSTLKTLEQNGKLVGYTSSFTKIGNPTYSNDTLKINGINCKKMSYNNFSNKIDMYYTKLTNIYASPLQSITPDSCLIVQCAINGSIVYELKQIVAINSIKVTAQENYVPLNESQYQAALIKSRYMSIPIFENEKINYSNINKQSKLLYDATNYFAKGNVILKLVTIPKQLHKGRCFIKLVEKSNGDAYDRLGSVFTLSNNHKNSFLNALLKGVDSVPFILDKKNNKYQGIISTENYSPATELMRFITPFGITYFNNKRVIDGFNWADSVVYIQEVTNILNQKDSAIWVGVYIGNYDIGGHNISLSFNYYPDESLNGITNTITPIFNTVPIMEADGQNFGRLFASDTLKTSVEILDNIFNGELVFTTTGHGGWDTGDEFVPKLNQIFIDNELILSILPWRQDCATNRLSNPASGNFSDGLSSSDYSRSNWCPGYITQPYMIPISNLSKGKHTIKLVIQQGPDFGSSFNHWSTSLLLKHNASK